MSGFVICCDKRKAETRQLVKVKWAVICLFMFKAYSANTLIPKGMPMLLFKGSYFDHDINFYVIHMTQSTLLVTRTRDFHLFSFCCIHKTEIRQSKRNGRVVHSLIVFYAWNIFIQTFPRIYACEEWKKCEECSGFIVQRVNKLISIGCVSFHCVAFGFRLFFSFLFLVLFRVIVFESGLALVFSSQSRARNIFGSAFVFKSNIFPFGYQKWIRYELQCN